MAEQTNLVFALGETWEIPFALNDADGEDLDLSGAAVVTFDLKLRQVLVLTVNSADSPEAVAIESPSNGNGTITVAPEDQAAAGVVARVYEFQVWAVLQDGRTTQQAFGSLTVTA